MSDKTISLQVERTISLIDFVKQAALIKSKTPSNLISQTFHRHELTFSSLPGIHLNVEGDDGYETWITINRLREHTSPITNSIHLKAWLNVSNNPDKQPTLKAGLPESTLLELNIGYKPERKLSENDIELVLLQDYALKFELENLFKSYLNNSWKPWAIEEKKRRDTIALYATLFTLKSQLEGEIIESQLELVIGSGIAVWKKNDVVVTFPLVTKMVELSLNETTMDLIIRPRLIEPKLELDIYAALDNQGVGYLEKVAKEFFTQNDNNYSPFDNSTFEPILKAAVTHLDPKGIYWPESTTSDDRALPKLDEDLKVTDTWVIFSRPRSNSILIQDLERLKKKAEEGLNLPASLLSIVNDPSKYALNHVLPNFRGLSNVSGYGNDGSESKVADLFFPKPFNDEQVRIIQMLENSPGVIVQGPPGTGKTHTIANIICHHLALGKRVLVTSMRDPALAVLKDQLPEDIQPLCISLLTSEQQGMKQFEYAIQKIASEVSSIDKGSLNKEIKNLELQLDEFHQSLYAIDKAINRWAMSNLTKLTIDGDSINPVDAARQLVADRHTYEWLTDEITISDKHSPLMTEKDMSELREARLNLREDIHYIDKNIPSLSCFPESIEIIKVHRDLCQLDTLKEAVKMGSIPEMANGNKATYDLAANLIEEISNLKNIKNELNSLQSQWYEKLKNKIKNDFNKHLFSLFDQLVADIDLAENDRNLFIKKPIHLPAFNNIEDEVQKAVKNLSNGKSAFGISGFIGKTHQKEFIEKIRVLGNKPKDKTEWSHISDYFDFLTHVKTLMSRWNALAPEIQIRHLDTIEYTQFNKCIEYVNIYKKVMLIVNKEALIDSNANKVIPTWTHRSETTNNIQNLNKFEDYLIQHLTKNRLSDAWALKEKFQQITHSFNGKITDKINLFSNNSIGDVSKSEKDIQNEWTLLMDELKRVSGLASNLKIVERVAETIERSGAPKWANSLRHQAMASILDPLVPADFIKVWRLRRLHNYLETIDARAPLKKLTSARTETEKNLASTYRDVISKRTWFRLAENATPEIKAALAAFLEAIKKIGKGTGKRAIGYRHDARVASTRANSAIPCWIMPHYRVSETLPAELGAFDLVIIDEASQSDLTALPALLRAKKILVVGDDKQVSPEGVGMEVEKIQSLMNRYLTNQVEIFRSLFSPDRSIYDLFKVVFSDSAVMLKEHFRCVGPIIEYSKREFYNHELKPLRLPKNSERLDPPLIDVYIENGFNNIKDNVNRMEARFIVDEIQAITSDPKMKGRTIGVVSLLGDKQSLKVWQMLEEELGPEVIQEFKIACGDAKTFQGKERSIMFLTMVVAPNEPIFSITRDTFSQRFNVAASRAQDRMYLVRSVELEDLKPSDVLRRGLISHFNSPYAQDEKSVDSLKELCESPFELEVYDELTNKGYRVIPQVKVGGFRIDLVVEGANDIRLAIECDGDQFHGPDKWEDDLRRQRILERAGWKFWRCFASTFVLHKQHTINDLIQTLSSMGIEPMSNEGSFRSSYTSLRRCSPGLESFLKENLEQSNKIEDDVVNEASTLTKNNIDLPFDLDDSEEPTKDNSTINKVNKPDDEDKTTKVLNKPKINSEGRYINVNDIVTYIDLSNPSQKIHIQLVDVGDDFANGLVNKSRPLSQVLLNAEEGIDIEFSVPGRPTQILRVIEVIPTTIVYK